MEEAVVVRRVAREAVADVEPVRLRENLTTHIDDGSVAPGVLTVLVGRSDGVDASDAGDGLLERAAGVQLVYDGLRLTRRLADEVPWRDTRERNDQERHYPR